ncbi:unnamed protein product [Caenorhabditis auriculariae]|uniref:CHK kinase-like domain-containing protein n=1 Tax=Caenorhabditis auriculariae TaxID=2777116 RepID=A0A8S1GUK3_9PELO|nr:unnamed protein product [Caenorhabditis auriculariae]
MAEDRPRRRHTNCRSLVVEAERLRHVVIVSIVSEELLRSLPLEEIEEQLRTYFSTSATFGPRMKITGITSGWSGSELFLLFPDFEEATTSEIPEKCLLKVTRTGSQNKRNGESLTEKEIEERDGYLRKNHNNEVRWLRHFNKNKQDDFKTIPMYASNFMNDENQLGYIVMQFVEGCGYADLETIPQSVIIETLKALAKLQALSLPESEEKTIYERPIMGIYDLTEVNLRNHKEKFLKLKSESDFCADLIEEVLTVIDEMTPDFLRFFDEYPYREGMRDVVCHGDMYAGNTLYKREAPHEFIAIIDLQSLCLSNGVIDFLHYITESLPYGDDRHSKEFVYMGIFYDFVCQEFTNDNIPYTYQQLEECYKQQLPMAKLDWCLYLLEEKNSPSYENKTVEFRRKLEDSVVSMMKDIIKSSLLGMAQTPMTPEEVLELLPLEDIEKQFQTYFSTKSTFGPQLRLTGFESGLSGAKLFSLYPDWQNEPSDELPEMCLVKVYRVESLKDNRQYATPEERFAARRCLGQYHNNEVKWLRFFAEKKINTFNKVQIYASELIDGEVELGYIVMQYIEDCHFSNGGDVPGAVFTETLRALAKLQAVPLSDAEKAKAYRPAIWWLYHLTPKELRMIRNKFFERRTTNNWEDLIDKVIAAIDEMTPDFVQFFDQYPENAGMSNVLCHADLSIRNTLFKTEPPHEFIGIIDYQTLCVSNGALDILKYLTEFSPRGEDFFENLSYLRTFHEFVCEEFGSDRIPYTYQQLEDCYKQFFPFYQLRWCADYLIQRSDPYYENEGIESRKAIDECFTSNMKEIVFYHKRNAEIFAESKKSKVLE